MIDPNAALTRGIMAAFAEMQARDVVMATVRGPFDKEAPPDDIDEIYPYATLEVDASIDRFSCGRQYWNCDATIIFREKDKVVCAELVQKFLNNFSPDSHNVKLTNAEIHKLRVRDVRYRRDDKKVFAGVVPLFMVMSVVRA